MKKVKIVLCPHCGGQINPLPIPRGAAAPAGVIECWTGEAGDFTNESSNEETANNFAAALRRNSFGPSYRPAQRNRL
ncbi:MAG TPA: hypothetical protein VIE89_15150 [Candidatus Binatia bacterium]|jgi:hypothetical protein